MSAITEYKKFKHNLEVCNLWFALYGNPYRGGGGGIGHFSHFELQTGKCSPTIYHQFSDGATNYHSMPKELEPFISQVLKAEFPRLFEKALNIQKEKLADLAKLAKEEFLQIEMDESFDIKDVAKQSQDKANEHKD